MIKSVRILLISSLLILISNPVLTQEKIPRNDPVISWNLTAYELANEKKCFDSFKGVHTLILTHLAIHDVLNSIYSKYEQYAFEEKDSKADAVAALSQAAYDILITVFPEDEKRLNSELQKWLQMIDEGEKKNRGIYLGKKAAAAILKVRENDGYDANAEYSPADNPGDYQFTPGFNFAWKPDLTKAKSFSLQSPDQFRASPPPGLKSAEYRDDYNEVKMYGAKNSKIRNEDQTNYAHWWAEYAEHSWNRIGRLAAAARKLPLLETARMFALINMNIYDIYLAVMESKYHYNKWRPCTAIINGDKDGNSGTDPDPKWEPEMQCPPFPEYPSGHAAVGAGGAEILTHVFGTAKVSFTMESSTALEGNKIRTYHNLDKAADDCADSRVMNGFHFRFATEEGKHMGRKIAKHIISNCLKTMKISGKQQGFLH